jgi:glucosamine-6-phosphate deaminase
MPRLISKVAPEWWDFTTLDPALARDAAGLSQTDLTQLSRPGFRVHFYETVQEFYAAEALEYIEAFRQATADNPVGICGPIGPTEQLPLVARMVNSMGLKLCNAHFWGMDEWVQDGKPVDITHPLSFARTDMELCFNRIDPGLRMPADHLHFPTGDLEAYSRSFDSIRCAVMQGGQGWPKHWAFNDPPRRERRHSDQPPSPAEYRRLGARIVELHPLTVIQNAAFSTGGNVSLVPTMAATVGPKETWKAEAVSIWRACTTTPSACV